jgi:hypothetical protein
VRPTQAGGSCPGPRGRLPVIGAPQHSNRTSSSPSQRTCRRARAPSAPRSAGPPDAAHRRRRPRARRRRAQPLPYAHPLRLPRLILKPASPLRAASPTVRARPRRRVASMPWSRVFVGGGKSGPGDWSDARREAGARAGRYRTQFCTRSFSPRVPHRTWNSDARGRYSVVAQRTCSVDVLSRSGLSTRRRDGIWRYAGSSEG